MVEDDDGVVLSLFRKAWQTANTVDHQQRSDETRRFLKDYLHLFPVVPETLAVIFEERRVWSGLQTETEDLDRSFFGGRLIKLVGDCLRCNLLVEYADLGSKECFGQTQFQGEIGNSTSYSLRILISSLLRDSTRGQGLVAVGGIACRGVPCTRLVILHELLHVVEYICRSHLVGESILVGHDPKADEKNEMFMTIFNYFSYLHNPYLEKTKNSYLTDFSGVDR